MYNKIFIDFNIIDIEINLNLAFDSIVTFKHLNLLLLYEIKISRFLLKKNYILLKYKK